ncbi:archaellin/type IV pilin N-terminal domain-containing protein [Halomarina halobia]|uniref:Archaellin/type IV pilin N-terminal domain-containing protein n=1 Tax=Halomarina halobia TaxID=3033386 RepID=A0ABD6A698_9EURY|nr:archaellin/type IV pilin N-terminal domain-containing protein [Halomarina sp. PSR21]
MNESASPRRSASPSRNDRGQSEVLGVVLILGITIAGTTAVAVFGAPVLSNAQQAVEIKSAEHAMTKLDSKASLVGFDDSPSQEIDLGIRGTGGAVRVNETSGRITIDRTDAGGNTTTLLARDLGAVIYENGDTTITYQGGGVWKQTGDGSTMISPPEFHYRDRTLTLPLIIVDGDRSIDGRVQVSAGPSQSVFPIDGDANKSNPLVDDRVNVTVTSRYYEAWGDFFEERTGGQVTYDSPNQTVTVTLVSPATQQPVTQGVSSTSPAKRMHIDGKHGDVFIDTYNSSDGNYTATGGSGGTIVTAGGVDIQHGTLNGSLVSGGGEVNLKKDSYITDDLAYGGALSTHDAQSSHVGGDITSDGSAPIVDPIDGFIDQKQTEIANDPDVNTDSDGDIDDKGDTDPTNDELVGSRDSWTLTDGTYYLETIDLKGNEALTLNNTNGPVEIYVEKDFKLDGATLNVTDESGHTVRIYVGHKRIEVTNGATVSVPEDRSSKLWLYGSRDTHIKLAGSGTRVTGVIYAPSGDTDPGKIELTEHAELFGAVVGGEARLERGATIHYDETLSSQAPIPPGTDVAQLTYLHATTNTVTITDE